MSKAFKVPVTERAFLQRVNRALAKEGGQVRAVRGAARSEVGAWVRIDRAGKATPLDNLLKLGAELGVLQEWEAVVEEEE